jgi:4-oxalocrotonate tautomerase
MPDLTFRRAPFENARALLIACGGQAMPHVQITWVEGRTPEQKRKIAERITGVLIEDGKAKRENIHVAFHDVPATDYAEAGVLVVDQKRTP